MALDSHKDDHNEALEREIAQAVDKERALIAKHEKLLAEHKLSGRDAASKEDSEAYIARLQEQHAKVVSTIKQDSEQTLKEALENADNDRQKQLEALKTLNKELMSKIQRERALAQEKHSNLEDMNSAIEEKYKHLHDVHTASKEQHAEHLEAATRH